MTAFIDEHRAVYGVEPIGNIPPIEFENLYQQRQGAEPAMVVGIP